MDSRDDSRELEEARRIFTQMLADARIGVQAQIGLPVVADDGNFLPAYAHDGDAGMDCRASEDADIPSGGRRLVDLGFRMAVPTGYVGLLFPRSGLATKLGVSLANCVGVVDSGYRGPVKASMVNLSDADVHIGKGERVCQLMLLPYPKVVVEPALFLDDTERGGGGFGSTGTR